MKYILIIGDGMADDPLEELGGRTPLEVCSKPYFDSLSERGTLGLVQTIPEGFPPGSDTAIMSIFGCDPAKYFSGRAPLELAASGGVMPEGGACYRCNMVTLGGDESLPFAEKTMVSHSAGSIEGDESDELIEWLFGHEEFKPMAEAAGMSVRPGSSFRHLAVQENGDIAGIVLAPPHDHLGEQIGGILPAGNANAKTLLALMEKANALLEHHPINEKRRAEGRLPANGIWFWAEGKGARLPNFTEHYGATGGVVSAVPLCHGIAVLVGLEPISVPTATGEWDTDYEAKTQAALDQLRTHDFAAVHLEGPDEATHNHDLEHKIYSVECLSERVAKPLCEALRARGEDFRMLILSDHRTFMRNGAHGATPVPFMIYDSRELTPGSGLGYSEANGGHGPFLGSGVELMPLLFEQ